MKIYTSYFYMIRHFPKSLIPVSTAKWDPKWYHDGQDQKHIFIDKRGIYNGIRLEELSPGVECEGMCSGNCMVKDTKSCLFLRTYKRQLYRLNFKETVERLEEIARVVKRFGVDNGEVEYDIALIFHEAPNNPCSERGAVQEWFRNRGVEVVEWRGSNETD